MTQPLEGLADDHVLSLRDAANLIGLEPLKLEYFALNMTYGLKSKYLKGKRQFVVADLKAFLRTRSANVSTATDPA
jgi:hypothetical protein